MTTIAFWEPFLPRSGLTYLFHTFIRARELGRRVRVRAAAPSEEFDLWRRALGVVEADAGEDADEDALTLVYLAEHEPKGAPFWVAVVEYDRALREALDFADGSKGSGMIVGMGRDEEIEVPEHLYGVRPSRVPFSRAVGHAGRSFTNVWSTPTLASSPGANALRSSIDHLFHVIEDEARFLKELRGVVEALDVDETAPAPEPEPDVAAADAVVDPAEVALEEPEDELSNDVGALLALVSGRELTLEQASVGRWLGRRRVGSWLRGLSDAGRSLKCGLKTAEELAEELVDPVVDFGQVSRDTGIARVRLPGFFERPGAARMSTLARIAVARDRGHLLELAALAAPPRLRLVDDDRRREVPAAKIDPTQEANHVGA